MRQRATLAVFIMLIMQIFGGLVPLHEFKFSVDARAEAVTIVVDETTIEAIPGEALTIDFTCTNTGDDPEQFTIELSSEEVEWDFGHFELTAANSASEKMKRTLSVAREPGASGAWTEQVTFVIPEIPYPPTQGDTKIITLKVYPTNDTTAYVIKNVTVIVGTYHKLEVTPEQPNIKILAGEIADITVYVKNLGNVPDNVQISVIAPDGWTMPPTLDPSTFTLKVNEERKYTFGVVPASSKILKQEAAIFVNVTGINSETGEDDHFAPLAEIKTTIYPIAVDHYSVDIYRGRPVEIPLKIKNIGSDQLMISAIATNMLWSVEVNDQTPIQGNSPLETRHINVTAPSTAYAGETFSVTVIATSVKGVQYPLYLYVTVRYLDLEVIKAEVTPDTFSEGDSITLTAHIKADGNQDVHGLQVIWTTDFSANILLEIAVIDAGETYVAEYIWTVPDAGMTGDSLQGNIMVDLIVPEAYVEEDTNNNKESLNVIVNKGVGGDKNIIISVDSYASVISTTDITITGSASSTNGIESIEYSIDGSRWAVGEGAEKWSFTATGITKGNHEIHIKAIDILQKDNTKTITIKGTVAESIPGFETMCAFAAFAVIILQKKHHQHQN